jgi:hypothetical protein
MVNKRRHFGLDAQNANK